MTRICFLFAVAAVFVLGTSVAHARDFNCDASALRLTLGGQATVEPVTANRGAASCKEAKSQTSTQIGPVIGGVLVAETTLPNGEAQARGGLAALRVNADALAALPIPTLDAVAQLPAVAVPGLGALPAFTIDIRPAVKALVAGLKAGPLLELNGSVATAHARCVNSKPQLSGETQVAGLKV